MTQALCLQCGDIKFGAICPCEQCGATATGDMNLDIAFSDHQLTEKTLRELGKVIAALHTTSDDAELCYWTFIHYISTHHSSILGVDFKPELQSRCSALLQSIDVPEIQLEFPTPLASDANGETDADGTT